MLFRLKLRLTLQDKRKRESESVFWGEKSGEAKGSALALSDKHKVANKRIKIGFIVSKTFELLLWMVSH